MHPLNVLTQSDSEQTVLLAHGKYMSLSNMLLSPNETALRDQVESSYLLETQQAIPFLQHPRSPGMCIELSIISK